MGLYNRNEYEPFNAVELIWYFALLCAVVYDAWNTSASALKNIDSSGINDLQSRKYFYAKQVFSIRLTTSVALIFATWLVVTPTMIDDELPFDFGPLNGFILYAILFGCYFCVLKVLKIYIKKIDDSIFY